MLARLEAHNFWFRSRNRLILWALQRQCPSVARFLELGCGTGFVLSAIGHAFPRWLLTGSEIHNAGLRFAAARAPGAELVQMDARAIPYREEFDAIGAFDVLEHIPEDELVLRELGEALQPGGTLLLTVPQHRFLWSQADVAACHVRRYSARELRRKVEDAGFRVERLTSFVSLLLPLMTASRLLEKLREGGDPLAELRVPPRLNAMLERVMELELALIRRGLRLRAGGSLLLAARRNS
jgi:SAM-dependent methyltransferase